MKNGGVTIKTIAADLGISYSTVSKALNGDPNIKEETRLLVEEKARELHYTRNYFAESLRRKDSKTVAVLLNDLDIPAYSEMISLISSDLAAYGYTTIVSDSRHDPEAEQASLRAVLGHMPDAIIYSPVALHTENHSLLLPYADRTLILSEPTDSLPASYLVLDHKKGGYLSACHMLENGITDSCIFCGPEGYRSADLFLEGIMQAFEEYSVPFDAGRVLRFRPDLMESFKRFLRLWNAEPGFTRGVICFCDSMAFGIYRAAKELGISVPEDISVIGYDDSPANEFTAPPLTTLHVPKDLIAKHCSQFVVNRLLNGDSGQHISRLEPFLARRGSVKIRHGSHTKS